MNSTRGKTSSISRPDKYRPVTQARFNNKRGTSRRAAPGAAGKGDFFHIEVRPRTEFAAFRTQDVGKPGGIERVAGKRADGSWATQKWLVSKSLAHVKGGRLVPTNRKARELLEELDSAPVHVIGDRFKARASSSGKQAPKASRSKRTNLQRKLVIAYENVIERLQR